VVLPARDERDQEIPHTGQQQHGQSFRKMWLV
jgi:hypothetical protein